MASKSKGHGFEAHPGDGAGLPGGKVGGHNWRDWRMCTDVVRRLGLVVLREGIKKRSSVNAHLAILHNGCETPQRVLVVVLVVFIAAEDVTLHLELPLKDLWGLGRRSNRLEERRFW